MLCWPAAAVLPLFPVVECEDGYHLVCLCHVGLHCARAFTFEERPCVGHPPVGVHGEFLAHGDFGGFHVFPADRSCGRLVVAQHPERFHGFGVVVDQLVDAVLVAFALQADDAVEPLATEELGEVAVVDVDLAAPAEERGEFAEDFGTLVQ